MHIFSPLAGSVGRIRTATAVLVLTLALTGCATVPPPDDSMNLAQTQLQAARDAGAADYAPVDLGFAQDKFQQAQTAMAARKYADAANLAEESRADAELARAKARLGAARAQIQSKVQDNTRLRAQGEQAAAAEPAPAAAVAPSSAPTEDMPAPDSSELSAPLPGAGFQTLPDNGQQPASSSSIQEVQP
ncbi:DUF4398 domain-containing protein [Rhodanobacter glycinis]|uniref:DUF4398 domain-containing protein n=1 Tax=Rhodanobacter glycinis TaxID=582702 RepID=A0A502CJA4_9GAMM|nr:DUF4398 domain-containing protein [Rhodanobacter glycinis]TPG11856.1 DUF4398 domain-containing protein [Rhodanobacter glycinis]TPG48666.1 DUF4398 domain-containing protein [Rhodanobacter glycinis]